MYEAIGNLPFAQAQSTAWHLLLAARRAYRQTDACVTGFALDHSKQEVVPVDAEDATACLRLDAAGHWCCAAQLPRVWQAAFDLYLPVLGGRYADSRVIAHLGQSLDACIATPGGDSFYVTGEENRRHLHCLRALNDAVIVGAGTALADDPQLTTRAVAGDNPVRIVIDPQARLPISLGICCDGQARTVLLHQSSANLAGLDMDFGPPVTHAENTYEHQVQRWVIPCTDELMSPRTMVKFLGSRGLKRIFVEGGGITVSKFFEDAALHRLHVAVAPLLVGQGRQALQLPASKTMKSARRPPHAIYRMGEDILWDFDVDPSPASGAGNPEHSSGTRAASLTDNGMDRIM